MSQFIQLVLAMYILPKSCEPFMTKAGSQPLSILLCSVLIASVALRKCHVSSPYFLKTFPCANTLRQLTRDQVKHLKFDNPRKCQINHQSIKLMNLCHSVPF